MAVRKFKPVTPGTRHKIIGTFDEITTNVPEKSLVSVKKSSGGRNNTGKMTVRYIGGGHKRMYRHVDFKRVKDGVAATVKTIEYDPNRTARIACWCVCRRREELYPGSERPSGRPDRHERRRCRSRSRNTLFLSEIPLGTVIHNIELYPGQAPRWLVRPVPMLSLLAREGKFAVIKLPSGETRMVLVTCRATVGVVSNVDHSLESSGKAGRERWLGRRPRNRGVVMNPVDHPMGGGEGRASGGHPRSRKGLLAKGYKTRNPKKTTSKFIISRKKK